MRKKVLVIDDDPMVRNLVGTMLQAEGYDTVLAAGGKEGVSILESQDGEEFALVVLDVMMPDMNGLDVLTRLRLHPRTNSMPVLMLTGETQAEDIMAGYNVGADYYITKPFTRQQLRFGLSIVAGGKEQK